MKAKLEFSLPDEQHEFNCAVNGRKMYSILWELDQWLRSNVKYSPDSMSEDEIKAYDKCRDQLRDLMLDESISFD
jgi:hypothetical protein